MKNFQSTYFRHILFFSLFILNGFSLFSQELTKQLISYDVAYLLGKSDSNFIVLERSNSEMEDEGSVLISCYTSELQKKWSFEKVGSAKYSHHNIFYFNEKVYLMTGDNNDLKTLQEYKINHILNADGISVQKPLSIFSINTWNENKKLRNPIYQFDRTISGSGKSILFTYSNDYKEPIAEGFSYRILSGDSVLSELKKLELPYSDPLCNVEDMIFENDSANIVYLLVKIYDVASVKKRKVIGSEVFSYNLDNNTFTKQKIPMDNSAGDIRFFRRNNYFYLGYLFTDSNSVLTTGIKTLKFDKNFNVIKTYFQPYHINYEDSVYFIKNNIRVPYNLVDLCVLSNDDIITVSENNNFTTKYNNGVIVASIAAGIIGGVAGYMLMPILSNDQYDSGSMMVSYMSASDGDGYSTKIKKYQKDKNFQHISHLLLEGDTAAFLIFTRDSLRRNSTIADLACYRVAKNGCNENNTFLMPEGVMNPRPKTGSYITFDNNNFIIAAAEKRKNYLLKLSNKN